eukprot:2726096-Prymnesium_polylepis.1
MPTAHTLARPAAWLTPREPHSQVAARAPTAAPTAAQQASPATRRAARAAQSPLLLKQRRRRLGPLSSVPSSAGWPRRGPSGGWGWWRPTPTARAGRA